MSLFSKLQRERTNPRVKATVTFNAPGTYFPEYGKTIFTVGGRGATGGTNAPVPGTTNPGIAKIATQTSYTGKPGTPPFSTTNFSVGGNGNSADNYCDPFVADNNSFGYNGSQVCYGFFTEAGNTNSPSPGSNNPGANANIYGVPFPGGSSTTAPVVGDTVVSLPFSNSGYSVTVPTGGFVTFKNK